MTTTHEASMHPSRSDPFDNEVRIVGRAATINQSKLSS